MHGEIAHVHDERLVVARGIQRRAVVVRFAGERHGVHVHGRREHTAVIVIGMIAGDFGAAGRGNQFAAIGGAEMTDKVFLQRLKARKLPVGGFLAAIQAN